MEDCATKRRAAGDALAIYRIEAKVEVMAHLTHLRCMCFFWLSGRPTLMPTYSWTGTSGAGLRACMQWVALRVANSATMQHRHEKCKLRSFFVAAFTGSLRFLCLAWCAC